MEDRVQKLLAQAGFGSRRACEEYILQGRVRVNGLVAVLGQKADPAQDEITLDGEALVRPEKLTYLLLYKPRGVVSSLEPQGDRKTVRDLVPGDERLYPVGRLDLDSEGLILLTNDGDLTNRLTHPRYEIEKEYRVLVAQEPDEKQLTIWRNGVVLEGKRTAPAEVERDGRSHEGFWLRVVMHEGRKHEIRDIAKTLGMWVHKLIRVRLGMLTIGTLRAGQWRPLEPKEIQELRNPPGKTRSRGGAKAGSRSGTKPATRSAPPVEKPHAPRRGGAKPPEARPPVDQMRRRRPPSEDETRPAPKRGGTRPPEARPSAGRTQRRRPPSQDEARPAPKRGGTRPPEARPPAGRTQRRRPSSQDTSRPAPKSPGTRPQGKGAGTWRKKK